MLEKIQIRGFGANEKVDVEFGPYVTSIIGENFRGKSWLLRGLKWVCKNTPAGDAFINWDCDEAKVRLTIDGKVVTRIRNNRINSFRLSGKREPFTAFGNDVPQVIARLINVSGRLNFQGQHSTKDNRIPFWFCETAGEVSRQLNSIVNLELIDVTLANIQSEQRDTNTIVKAAEKDLEKAVAEQKRLSYVEDLDAELKHVESLQKEHRDIVEKRSTIEEIIKSVQKHTYIRENSSRLVSDGRSVLSSYAEYTKFADLASDLSDTIETVRELRQFLENRPPSIEPLEKLREHIEHSSVPCEELDELIESIEHGRQLKCQKENELESLQQELSKAEDNRQKCPYCGKTLPF